MGPPSANFDYLNVPRLKALCKERGLTGYSKLKKDALILKLAQAVEHSSELEILSKDLAQTRSAVTPSSGENQNRDSTNSPESISHLEAKESALSLNQNRDVSSGTPSTVMIDSQNLLHIPPLTPVSGGFQNPETEKALDTVLEKRKLAVTTFGDTKNGQLCAPVAGVSFDANKVSSPRNLVPKMTTLTRPGKINTVTQPAESSSNKLEPLPAPKSSAPSSLPPSKRFRPLLISKQKNVISVPASSEKRFLTYNATQNLLHSDVLDFRPVSIVPHLEIITLPPTLSQRKYALTFSVILSYLDNSSRRNVVLTSRAMRYAVYLSALVVLKRDSPGMRLAQMTRNYNPSVTNFWPYLRYRQTEHEDRLNAYHSSFFTRLLDNLNISPVADRLWTCPDNGKQLTIVLRFILTRIWFTVSLPPNNKSARSSLLDFKVLDAKEIIPSEIWSLTIRSSNNPHSSGETFYVLEPTCEIIGHPQAFPSTKSFVESHPSQTPLRLDWSAYIERRLAGHAEESVSCDPFLSSSHTSLFTHFSWSNREEYTYGISKLWLSRVSDNSKDPNGAIKRTIAHRYIFAHVVGNSLSGKWMSSIDMAQEFAGKSSDIGLLPHPRRNNAARINFFLPEHHFIESVHLHTQLGVPLHGALAVIQTPGREYYVLRDNGMEVGCEEDGGVWEVWRKILSCTEKGVFC